MATPVRLVVAFAVALLSAAAAFAQPETAPPPHPTLAEVVKEYRRLELPLPLPGAELVRIKWMKHGEDPDGPLQRSDLLGFKLSPTAPGKDPRYLIGDGHLWENEWIDPARVEPVDPTPEALALVDMDGRLLLCLAAQCELRGWHDLARAAYARARDWYVFVASLNKESEPPIIDELRDMSWWLWARQTMQPGTDRRAILKRLQEKAAEDPRYRTPPLKDDLRRLALTVAPRKSKPGTVEALIDDLTEYWDDPFEPPTPAGKEVYWKLAERGFDAVPALIDHLGDDRESRAFSAGFNNFRPYTLTVGHLCSRLLYDLSARKIGGGYWALRGDRIDPKHAREWFAKAQEIGEEKWLLEHAVPQGDPGPIVNQSGRPEWLIVRVIAAKYPALLPDIYRAMLRKKSSSLNTLFVPEILASPLPREQKAALFEEGATHRDFGHRLRALEGLAETDQALFRKHLLRTLTALIERSERGLPWLPASLWPCPDTYGLVPLVERADDRACWATLLAVAKKIPCEERLDILGLLDPRFAPDADDPIRKERLRFLLQFLDDRSAMPDEDDFWKGTEVRDYTATLLAGLLRFPVERLYPGPSYPVQHDPNRGPISRFALRELVRSVATRELANLEHAK